MEETCCGVMRKIVNVLIDTCALYDTVTQIGLCDAMTVVTRTDEGRRSRMSENTSPYFLFTEDR